MNGQKITSVMQNIFSRKYRHILLFTCTEAAGLDRDWLFLQYLTSYIIFQAEAEQFQDKK